MYISESRIINKNSDNYVVTVEIYKESINNIHKLFEEYDMIANREFAIINYLTENGDTTTNKGFIAKAKAGIEFLIRKLKEIWKAIKSAIKDVIKKIASKIPILKNHIKKEDLEEEKITYYKYNMVGLRNDVDKILNNMKNSDTTLSFKNYKESVEGTKKEATAYAERLIKEIDRTNNEMDKKFNRDIKAYEDLIRRFTNDTKHTQEYVETIINSTKESLRKTRNLLEEFNNCMAQISKSAGHTINRIYVPNMRVSDEEIKKNLGNKDKKLVMDDLGSRFEPAGAKDQFNKSIDTARKAGVPEDKILKNKKDIDNYFQGTGKISKEFDKNMGDSNKTMKFGKNGIEWVIKKTNEANKKTDEKIKKMNKAVKDVEDLF